MDAPLPIATGIIATDPIATGRLMGSHLVLVAHGTRFEDGRRVVAAIADDVADGLPDWRTTLAYVDIQDPYVGEVTGRLAGSTARVLVMPLLLTVGYHVRSDIAGAVDACPGATALPPLGPHPLLADLQAQRLIEAGATARDAIVLASAGSSDPDAARDMAAVAAELARRPDADGVPFGEPLLGYGASAAPSVAEAVAAARETGRRVVIASYLLAPGHFHRRLGEAGADLVTAPLGPDRALIAVVRDRVDSHLKG